MLMARCNHPWKQGRLGIIEPCFVDGMSALMMDRIWRHETVVVVIR